MKQALNPAVFNKKSKDRLYQYLVFYNLYHLAEDLALLKYGPAKRMWEKDIIETNLGLADYYYRNELKSLMPYFLNHGVNFRSEVNFTPLMSAIAFEKADIIDYLLENGANIDLQDNLGNNAMQRLLFLIHKFNNSPQQKQLFSRFYSKLKPESVKVRINNRLIKIGNHEPEFLILSFMIVTLFEQFRVGCILQDPMHANSEFGIKPGYQTADFAKLFEKMPEHVMPGYRCNPAYLSSILSKNELNRKGTGNKKLFVRLKQGIYVPHPLMEINIDEEWVNVYDNISMSYLTERYAPEQLYFINLIHKFREQLTRNPDAELDQASYWEEILRNKDLE